MMKYTRDKCLKLWSQVVRERDNHTCQVCGATDVKLDAHHIIDKKYVPFDVDNGITLCSGCHKFSFYSAHQHAVWFALWLKKNNFVTYLKTLVYDYQKTKHDYEEVYERLISN